MKYETWALRERVNHVKVKIGLNFSIKEQKFCFALEGYVVDNGAGSEYTFRSSDHEIQPMTYFVICFIGDGISSPANEIDQHNSINLRSPDMKHVASMHIHDRRQYDVTYALTTQWHQGGVTSFI